MLIILFVIPGWDFHPIYDLSKHELPFLCDHGLFFESLKFILTVDLYPFEIESAKNLTHLIIVLFGP